MTFISASVAVLCSSTSDHQYVVSPSTLHWWNSTAARATPRIAKKGRQMRETNMVAGLGWNWKRSISEEIYRSSELPELDELNQEMNVLDELLPILSPRRLREAYIYTESGIKLVLTSPVRREEEWQQKRTRSMKQKPATIMAEDV